MEEAGECVAYTSGLIFLFWRSVCAGRSIFPREDRHVPTTPLPLLYDAHHTILSFSYAVAWVLSKSSESTRGGPPGEKSSSFPAPSNVTSTPHIHCGKDSETHVGHNPPIDTIHSPHTDELYPPADDVKTLLKSTVCITPPKLSS